MYKSVIGSTHAGLRVGEVVKLRVSDLEINDKDGEVIVRYGKGGKSRPVPLVLAAREPLKNWLEYRACYVKEVLEKSESKGFVPPKWALQKDGFVFLGRKGNFTERGIRFMTERVGDKAGVQDLSPHRLRHTFARAAIDPVGYGLNREAVPLPMLQDLLGHARIETTAIYTKFEKKDKARFLEEKKEP